MRSAHDLLRVARVLCDSQRLTFIREAPSQLKYVSFN